MSQRGAIPREQRDHGRHASLTHRASSRNDEGAERTDSVGNGPRCPACAGPVAYKRIASRVEQSIAIHKTFRLRPLPTRFFMISPRPRQGPITSSQVGNVVLRHLDDAFLIGGEA